MQSTSHAAPAGRKEAFVTALSLFISTSCISDFSPTLFLPPHRQPNPSQWLLLPFVPLSLFPISMHSFQGEASSPPPSRRMVHLSLSAFSAKLFFIICTAGVNSAEKERTQSRNKTRRHHHRNTHANIVSSASFLCPALILLVVRESKADMVSELWPLTYWPNLCLFLSARGNRGGEKNGFRQDSEDFAVLLKECRCWWEGERASGKGWEGGGSLMIRCLMLPLRSWGDPLPIPSKRNSRRRRGAQGVTLMDKCMHTHKLDAFYHFYFFSNLFYDLSFRFSFSFSNLAWYFSFTGPFRWKKNEGLHLSY